MSNPTVSFRISDYHLARGLRAVRTIEPNWKMTTPGELIRTVFNDYIAKSEFFNNQPLEVTPGLLQEIVISRQNIKQKPSYIPTTLPSLGITKQSQSQFQPTQGQPAQGQPVSQKPAWQIQRELEEERLFNEMRRESLAKIEQDKQAQDLKDAEIAEQIELMQQSNRRTCKPSEFKDPNITDSVITTVTDFSPPDEWKK